MPNKVEIENQVSSRNLNWPGPWSWSNSSVICEVNVTQFPEGYPEIFSDMATCLGQELLAFFGPDRALTVAFTLTEGLRSRFGGSTLYLPKGNRYQQFVRDEAICREFDGRNHRALAKKYRLNLATIYEIVGRKNLQKPTLFPRP